MFMEIVLFVILIFLICKWFSQPPKNFPPGPPSYPLIGGILSLPDTHLHFQQEKWLKQYGGIVGVMMGNRTGIFIQGTPYVQDALRKPEFQGRPSTLDLMERSFGESLGIFFSDGIRWVESRKFFVRYLKNFGVQNMELIMNLEMSELGDNIQSGMTYQMTDVFKESTANIIWTILSGSRCTVKDKKIKHLLDQLTEAFRAGRPGGKLTTVGLLIPVLRNFDEKIKIQREAFREQQDFFRESIQEHAKTLDPLNPRDFYDAYLIEQDRREKLGKNEGIFSEDDLIVITMDIFAASYETLNSTMAFTLMYLILNPEVQRRVHTEIDNVLGSRKPTLKDRPNLHYVDALLTEVYRINSAAPIVAPHRCLEDTTFHGYNIPKNSTIFVSLWSLSQDENTWDNPTQFRPERFLNEENKFVPNPNLHTFGIGKRICAGDFIANTVLFLYLTIFLQKYSVELAPNHPKLDTEALPGFTTSPKPYKAIIRERY